MNETSRDRLMMNRIQNRCDKQLINVTDRTRGKMTLKRNKLKVHTNKK